MKSWIGKYEQDQKSFSKKKKKEPYSRKKDFHDQMKVIRSEYLAYKDYLTIM